MNGVRSPDRYGTKIGSSSADALAQGCRRLGGRRAEPRQGGGQGQPGALHGADPVPAVAGAAGSREGVRAQRVVEPGDGHDAHHLRPAAHCDETPAGTQPEAGQRTGGVGSAHDARAARRRNRRAEHPGRLTDASTGGSSAGSRPSHVEHAGDHVPATRRRTAACREASLGSVATCAAERQRAASPSAAARMRPAPSRPARARASHARVVAANPVTAGEPRRLELARRTGPPQGASLRHGSTVGPQDRRAQRAERSSTTTTPCICPEKPTARRRRSSPASDLGAAARVAASHSRGVALRPARRGASTR